MNKVHIVEAFRFGLWSTGEITPNAAEFQVYSEFEKNLIWKRKTISRTAKCKECLQNAKRSFGERSVWLGSQSVKCILGVLPHRALHKNTVKVISERHRLISGYSLSAFQTTGHTFRLDAGGEWYVSATNVRCLEAYLLYENEETHNFAKLLQQMRTPYLFGIVNNNLKLLISCFKWFATDLRDMIENLALNLVTSILLKNSSKDFRVSSGQDLDLKSKIWITIANS